MPIIPGLITTIGAGRPYYRITPMRFRTPATRDHKKVVDGGGGVLSSSGGRYHYPGVRTVYLAEDPATSLAEWMYYFHREVLTTLDRYHVTGRFPAFQQAPILCEIRFRKDVPNIFELSPTNASAMGVYPSLMLNPSQDYNHLKDRRASIQSNGYQGLRAPSSRVRGTGHTVVLFQDQSRNLQSITPHEVEFRLITPGDPPTPFMNHATDLLDFAAGEVRVIPGPNPPALHPSLAAYLDWTRVEFNH